MSHEDKTREVLQEALAELFRQQALSSSSTNQGSYLLAQDGQFLGRITKNRHDSLSMLNSYGPHGSRFSQTSIFNRFSPYASRYAQYSINNPHSALPPQLFINDRLIGLVTVNERLKKAIDPNVFTSLLENNIDALLKGEFQGEIPESPYPSNELFLLASDGTFLGSLTTNQFDRRSIFNDFGPHGGKFSATSIYNQFSRYGGQFSQLSPYNQFTSTPPRIMRAKQAIAWVTKNTFLSPRVDPDMLKAYAEKHS